MVINHVTLDGAMQGLGRPDEDRRDGFTLDGWAALGNDLEGQGPVVGEAMRSVMSLSFSRLFGRRTYDDMVNHWNAVDKYIVLRGTTADLPWLNCGFVTANVTARFADRRERHEGNLVVMGVGVESCCDRSCSPRGWWAHSCSSCIRLSSAAGSVCSAESAGSILCWRRSHRHAVVSYSRSTGAERRCVPVSRPSGRCRGPASIWPVVAIRASAEFRRCGCSLWAFHVEHRDRRRAARLDGHA
ncbi:hypothetical protein ACO0E1_15300 [Curtobacterium sp. RRHDQ66]|uniref:hypothetical protein n=1 Tax=Curtobacterium guangdongense TaxID=3413380 RepID=UPI003BF2E220